MPLIRMYECLGDSPVMPDVITGLAELWDKGLLIPPIVPPSANAPVLVAFERITDHPVGFLVYTHISEMGAWWVNLAWVNPSHRGNGVHSALFEALVERARKRGDIRAIDCGTHVDNLAAQKAFEKQGREHVGMLYRYTIKSHSMGKDYLEI